MKRLLLLLITSILLAGADCCTLADDVRTEAGRRLEELEKLVHRARSKEALSRLAEQYAGLIPLLVKDGNRKALADAVNKLGYVHMRLGAHQQAEKHLRRGLRLSVDAGYRSGRIDALVFLGRLAENRNQHTAALKHYEEALSLARQLGEYKYPAELHWLVARVQERLHARLEAVRHYRQAVAIFEKRGARRGTVRSLHQWSRTCRKWNEIPKAIHCFNSLLSVARTVGENNYQELALRDLGSLHTRAGNHGKAVESYERCAVLLRKMGQPKSEAFVLMNLGGIYSKQGNWRKAVEFYQQALAIRRRIDDLKGEARTLNSLGNMYASSGRYATAVKFYKLCLAIGGRLNDRLGEASTLNALGIVYRKWNRYAKAEEYHQKALAIYRRISDPRGEAGTLRNLGLVYRFQGQHAKSEEFYEKSLAIHRRIKNPDGVARCLNNLAGVHSHWGRHEKAIELYEKALAIHRSIQNRRGEAFSLDKLGDVYSTWGQYSKAAEFYEKSLAIQRRINNPRGVAMSVGNLGALYYNWGHYTKAVESHKEMLTVSRKLNNLTLESWALNNLGNVYAISGQYAKAVEFYERSLEISRRRKSPGGEAGTLSNLGNIYRSWGRYTKAVESYKASLAISNRHRDRRREASALNSLGRVYGDWGQYAKAVEFLEKSLAIDLDIKYPKGGASSYFSLGKLHAQSGRYEKALASLEQSLSMRKKIGLPIVGVQYFIAGVYLDVGWTRKAEELIKQLNSSPLSARLHLSKKEFDKSRDLYLSLLRVAVRNEDADDLFTAFTGLGTAFEGMGKYPEAAEYYERAVDLTEKVRSTLPPPQRSKFFTVRINGFYRTAPYEGLARVLMKMDNRQGALRISEYTKARVFAESFARIPQNTGQSDGRTLNIQKEQTTDQIAALSARMREALQKRDKEAAASLRPQIETLEKRLTSLITEIREKYPRMAATRYPRPVPLWKSALKPEEWVISYDVTDSGILIYLTQGTEIVTACFKPYERGKLDRLVEKFRTPLVIVPEEDAREKLKSFDFTSGKKLADILLADLLPYLPEKAPVIIIPDDSLGVLPFEALVMNDHGTVATDKDYPTTVGAEFFGDRNPVSYYQSINALTLARKYLPAGRAPAKLLVVADPVFDASDSRKLGPITTDSKVIDLTMPTKMSSKVVTEYYRQLKMTMGKRLMGGLDWPRLKLTGTLARDLASMYPGASVYTGYEASKQTFFGKVAPRLKSFDKIVFATHGYSGSDVPGIGEPILVLSLMPRERDGYLRMSEVMALEMDADVVALTACQTGLGKNVTGEGTMAMGRAFQYAGARSALMSLWNVAETSSVDMVKRFFHHMNDGRSKREALGLARTEIRRAGYDHPFFWAPFILVGEVD